MSIGKYGYDVANYLEVDFQVEPAAAYGMTKNIQGFLKECMDKGVDARSAAGLVCVGARKDARHATLTDKTDKE